MPFTSLIKKDFLNNMRVGGIIGPIFHEAISSHLLMTSLQRSTNRFTYTVKQDSDVVKTKKYFTVFHFRTKIRASW